MTSRRRFIKNLTLTALSSGLALPATSPAARRAKVVVVGGGFGGATAAKYVKKWAPQIDVTLIEKNTSFYSCPMSNRVLSGVWGMGEITGNYNNLKIKRGIKVVHDEAVDVQVSKRLIKLKNSTSSVPYDRLIISPGVDFSYDGLPGMLKGSAISQIPHAWKAGQQTMILRKQLEKMDNGGTVIITVPRSPYRCPPGPYERACQIGYFLSKFKPKSKLIVLDANENIQSKKALFHRAWSERYQDIIEYHPMTNVVDVDAPKKILKLDFEDIKGDVLNVIPPQRAGYLARRIGLLRENENWCDVDFRSYESKVIPNIHVIGDAVMASPKMPKSGHMANQHAKVCAAAVCAMLTGNPISQNPMLSNTCYSFVSDEEAIHVAAVYKYISSERSMRIIRGSSGTSAANVAESLHAEAWAKNIWFDMLG